MGDKYGLVNWLDDLEVRGERGMDYIKDLNTNLDLFTKVEFYSNYKKHNTTYKSTEYTKKKVVETFVLCHITDKVHTKCGQSS